MSTRATWAIGAAAALAALALVPTAIPTPAQAIVGGVEVTPSLYPAYARISVPTSCGSTVIAPDTVLTAAHCVDDGVTAVTVKVSDVNPRNSTSITVHPLWNGDTDDGHDLAIVRLTPGSTNGVTPVQVGSPWNSSYYAANHLATIVGHGFTHGGGQVTLELRAADTILRSDAYMDDVYNKWYGFDHWNETFFIGAGSRSVTVCDGDSGGPLLVDKNGNGDYVQVGVASFVETWPNNCGEPGGFAELTNAQLAWVAQQVPYVTSRWGTCITPQGVVGQSAAQYVGWFLPSNHKDGPNYWEITCRSLPAPPPTTTPTTAPGPTPSTTAPSTEPTDPPVTDPSPDPTISPVCRRKPWLCEEAP